jgi:hypothetical protein
MCGWGVPVCTCCERPDINDHLKFLIIDIIQIYKEKEHYMKLFRFFLLLIPVSGLILFSCTKLDAPYVEIRHKNVSEDSTINWDTVPAIRKILLEDYTGHKCVNCPEASITAKSLEAANEGKVIVMAVHAGYYALPGSGEYTLDLRSEPSEEWNSEFGIISNPSGMVNRRVFGTSRVLGPDKWGDAIDEIITTAPDAQMLMKNTYDIDSRTLDSKVYTHFLNPLTGTYNIIVAVIEDSIIGAQKNNNAQVGPTPDWYNYIFNDVMRGSLNGTWGELLTASVNTTSTYVGNFSTVLDAKINDENCYLLAIIYNESTKEVVQVEKKKIRP